MGLIENDQIGVYALPSMHGIVQVIAQNFRCTDNNLCIRVLFPVTGQDPDAMRSENLRKLCMFCVGQGFQRRGIPCLLYTSDAADDTSEV